MDFRISKLAHALFFRFLAARFRFRMHRGGGSRGSCGSCCCEIREGFSTCDFPRVLSFLLSVKIMNDRRTKIIYDCCVLCSLLCHLQLFPTYPHTVHIRKDCFTFYNSFESCSYQSIQSRNTITNIYTYLMPNHLRGVLLLARLLLATTTGSLVAVVGRSLVEHSPTKYQHSFVCVSEREEITPPNSSLFCVSYVIGMETFKKCLHPTHACVEFRYI